MNNLFSTVHNHKAVHVGPILLYKCSVLCIPCFYCPFLGMVAWGFGRDQNLHIAHSSMYVAACRDRDKRQALCWKAETGIFFFPFLSLFHVCCSPTFSLAGREVSYALVVWDWRWRNHTQCLGSFRGPLEALIWNWGTDEHFSESAKTKWELLQERKNRQETMLLWISYVSN